jgi:NAD(P)-dependent dehydrogenase (short-subunit alcohol dehydrogenase family)
VGLARRKERVDQLAQKLSSAKGKLHSLKADMTVEADIINAFKWIRENLGPVAILINNAGLSQPNTLIGGNTEMWKTVLDTNVLGSDYRHKRGDQSHDGPPNRRSCYTHQQRSRPLCGTRAQTEYVFSFEVCSYGTD